MPLDVSRVRPRCPAVRIARRAPRSAAARDGLGDVVAGRLDLDPTILRCPCPRLRAARRGGASAMELYPALGVEPANLEAGEPSRDFMLADTRAGFGVCCIDSNL